MLEFDRKAAVHAANENRDLHERVDTLREENQNDKGPESKRKQSPSRLEKLQRRNDKIKGEISDLTVQLAELRKTNVTVLYHTYTKLNTKLASINDENMSLRSVIANQRQGVRKATQAFHDHQVRRKLSSEQNSHMKQDIQLMKERRDAAVGECDSLRKEKAQLEREVETLPQTKKDPEVTLRKLQKERDANKREIDSLESDIKEAEAAQQAAAAIVVEDDQDLEDLREEYKELKIELKKAKKDRGSSRVV